MSAYWQSKDEHWTVTPIVLNGEGLIRVEHDTVWLPDGTIVPVHWDGKHRCGIRRTAHGFLVGEFRTVAEVERYVPLHKLNRVDSGQPTGLCLPLVHRPGAGILLALAWMLAYNRRHS